MSVLDILMDSVEYPFKDWQKYLILGILLVITHFLSITDLFGQYSIILAIISVLLEIIIFGYFCSVVTLTIRDYGDIPSLNFVENIVDGFKYLVLSLVYSIIPLLILFYLFSVSGNDNPLWVIVSTITPDTTIMGLATGEFVQTFLQALINSKFVITYTIIFLLGILVSYLFFISLGKVLDSGKLSEGFKPRKIYEAYKEIGIESYSKWFLLILIYFIVFAGIWAILTLIPYGDYVTYLIIAPFILLFTGRSLGLIYRQNGNYSDYTPYNSPEKILNEEQLRREALEESARRYNQEIDRVNQLRKKNYSDKKKSSDNEDKPVKRIKAKKYTSVNKEKLDNLKPVTEVKPIHVNEDSVKKVEGMIDDDSVDTQEVMGKLQEMLEEKSKKED